MPATTKPVFDIWNADQCQLIQRVRELEKENEALRNPVRPRAIGYAPFRYTPNGEHCLLIHSIGVGSNEQVEVVGDPDNGAYEWGIREGGKIVEQSDCAYGQSSVALQHALNIWHK